jgi:hypothetical protein
VEGESQTVRGGWPMVVVSEDKAEAASSS